MLGEQSLVGGDHMLASLERGAHRIACSVQPAHDLNEHVDLGVCGDLSGVKGEQIG